MMAACSRCRCTRSFVKTFLGLRELDEEQRDPASRVRFSETFQPTIRSLWRMTETQTVWAAISRAVRTPSRIELFSNIDVLVPDTVPVLFFLKGNQQLEEEKLNAYELGWRWRPNPRLSFDASLYHNEYKDLINVITACASKST